MQGRQAGLRTGAMALGKEEAPSPARVGTREGRKAEARVARPSRAQRRVASGAMGRVALR